MDKERCCVVDQPQQVRYASGRVLHVRSDRACCDWPSDTSRSFTSSDCPTFNPARQALLAKPGLPGRLFCTTDPVFMGFFSNTKDRMVEQMALSYLNSKLSSYGRATRLAIDTTAKTIDLALELKGEVAPVEIQLSDYEICKEGERYFVAAKEIRTSREWLTALAGDQLRRGRFEIPPEAGSMLMRLL